MVVRRAFQRGAHLGGELVGVLVEQREVELELAREVLVEHRLADAGALGDVVHRRRVVAVGDEDLPRRAEQLLAARGARQAGASCRVAAGRGHVCRKRTDSATGAARDIPHRTRSRGPDRAPVTSDRRSG